MKKVLPLTIPLFIFLASLLYLHQKVQIYVEACRLNSNHQRYNELVDKRDYLMYNFAKEISLTKVNQWAENERFAPVGKERVLSIGIDLPKPSKGRVLALGAVVPKPIQGNVIISLLNRFLKTSASTSTVLAENNR